MPLEIGVNQVRIELGLTQIFPHEIFCVENMYLSLGKSTYISMYNNINGKFCIFNSKNNHVSSCKF